MSWDEDAACKGAATDAFFPETSATGPRREALRFCRACPVRRECLTAALEVPADIDYGVFGGLGVMARRRLRESAGFDPSLEVLPPVELTCVEGDCNGEAVEGRYCRGHANARLRARRAAKRVVVEKQVRLCSVEECADPHAAKGYCLTHYNLLARPRKKSLPMCVVEGCGAPSAARQLCMAHYMRQRRGQPLDAPLGPSRRIKGTCMKHNCREQAHRDGLCRVHYSQTVAEQYA